MGTTSAAAAKPSDDGGKAGSESDFLAQQSAAARAAARRVIDDLQANARAGWEHATDLRGWIDSHPWIAVGAASAAGFAAAAAVTPAPGQSLGEKLSSTFEAAMSQAKAANGQTEPDEAPAARAGRRGSRASLWGMLLEPVIEVLKVALQNYFTAYVAGLAASQATCAPASENSTSENSTSALAESTETNASPLA
jgi:hypothetical protein